jgi:hypothetical protein
MTGKLQWLGSEAMMFLQFPCYIHGIHQKGASKTIFIFKQYGYDWHDMLHSAPLKFLQ